MRICKKRFKAFSLLEIAISLAIIGVLALAVVKGQSLLHQARLDKTAVQVEAVRLGIETFRSTYAALPGDFNNSTGALDSVAAGDQDGKIEGAETSHFWDHLEKAGILSKQQILPAIGGCFSVFYDNGVHWLMLSSIAGKGLLSSKDAISIKMKVDGHLDNSCGIVRIRKFGDLVTASITSTKNKDLVLLIEFP